MEIDDDRKEDAIQKANERWDKVHSHYDRSQIKYDDWLDVFERAIKNCETPIIDLGCGSGNDTLYLIERGKKVIPCDYSKNEYIIFKRIFPK